MEIEYLAKEIKISQEEMRKVLGQVYSLPARASSPCYLLKSYNMDEASYVSKGETGNTNELLIDKIETKENTKTFFAVGVTDSLFLSNLIWL